MICYVGLNGDTFQPLAIKRIKKVHWIIGGMFFLFKSVRVSNFKVTKYSCAQDFYERSVRELQRNVVAPSSYCTTKRRKNAAKLGLALENPETLAAKF